MTSQILESLADNVQQVAKEQKYQVKEVRKHSNDMVLSEKETVLLALMSEAFIEVTCTLETISLYGESLNYLTNKLVSYNGFEYPALEDLRLFKIQGKFETKLSFTFYLDETLTGQRLWRKVIESRDTQPYERFSYEMILKADLSDVRPEIERKFDSPADYDSRLNDFSLSL